MWHGHLAQAWKISCGQKSAASVRLGVQLDTLRTQPHWATQKRHVFLTKWFLNVQPPKPPKHNQIGISAKLENAKILTVMTRGFIFLLKTNPFFEVQHFFVYLLSLNETIPSNQPHNYFIMLMQSLKNTNLQEWNQKMQWPPKHIFCTSSKTYFSKTASWLVKKIRTPNDNWTSRAWLKL